MHKEIVRRIFIFGFWPLIDFVITVLANVTLVNFGVGRAILTTVFVGTVLNVIFLKLLSFEKELVTWVNNQAKRVVFVKLEKTSVHIGKSLAVILAYAISGPAMVGAPLIWLLNLRGRRAYLLAMAGVTVNSIIWVGGFYNLFWVLVKTALKREIPFFF